MSTDPVEDVLAGVDAAKRKSLRRLIAGTAFAAPVVASFAIDGLVVSRANAICSNATIGCSRLF